MAGMAVRNVITKSLSNNLKDASEFEQSAVSVEICCKGLTGIQGRLLETKRLLMHS